MASTGPFRCLYQELTVTGEVIAVDPGKPAFSLKARSGDVFEAVVGPTTWYSVTSNLDGLDRNRVGEPKDVADEPAETRGIRYDLQKYIQSGRTVVVNGLAYLNGDAVLYEAKAVHLLHSQAGKCIFEETHWWLAQITQMADRWLDHLFDAKRSYTINDFSQFYRTNLNITGQETNDNVQESATLARLIYGLSSAYLLTGGERYFLAAKAAVAYQREAFRSLSHDGQYCFWASARRRNVGSEAGEQLVIASENPDDEGLIPLYEQIYALAGLAQYYRITLDWEVMEDIRRTVNTFQAFFWDPPSAKEEKGFAGTGGYYSHLDPVTMRPDSPHMGSNDENRARKNWNSIGDHIPAYLINLVLSLDPLPEVLHGPARDKIEAFLEVCRGILEETTDLIIEKFPDPDSDYVNERFFADWTPDHTFRWQQNRAVVGHNLKIAWNLTRCAFYFETLAKDLRDRGQGGEASAYEQRASRCHDLSRRLGDKMADLGLDKVRGGIFDCVERKPLNGMQTHFVWQATKDFWQQEQGILAYLILHGAADGDQKYLALARECSAFWNLFFLDRDRQGIYFRTTENGLPIIEGSYGQKGGHSVSGYHAYELNYLAHLYTRAFVDTGRGSDRNFCVYFKILSNRDLKSLNVLPDFVPPGHLEIRSIRANGIDVTKERKPPQPNFFQIDIDGLFGAPGDGSIELVVELGVINA
jgi:mannose/cellobiose epimerase-like protein (N-acyl-D-glucosamine 2-epimerase family)